MSEKLYDALEVCLNALETGVDLETVLQLYPEEAEELRPVLEASIQARALATPAVPEAALRRGRARVLQHANEMRKSTPGPRKVWSLFAFPRLATSLTMAFILLLSVTSLVSASNGALPGDNLYPVKRSWEGLRLFFVFSPGQRAGLESEFEQERLDEISELLTDGRHETIAFAGLVTGQNSAELKVSGITVMLTADSHMPADALSIGTPVIVIGRTNAQGFVEVDTLEVLGPGASLPPLEPSHMQDFEVEEPDEHAGEQDTPVAGQPEQLGTLTYEFTGVVEAIEANVWTINGQQVNVEFAENVSRVSVGELVEFEGYYSVEGRFIVTKIEIESSGLFQRDPLNSSGKGSGSSDDNSGSSGGDENKNNSDNRESDDNSGSGGGNENNNDNGDDDDD